MGRILRTGPEPGPTGGDQALICFAVKEEAKFFKEPGTDVLITGMGGINAEAALQRALAKKKPGLVLSCGFAGALNPALGVGDIVFQADEATGLIPLLAAAGASPAQFHFSARVATTSVEKKLLRESTGADAVEMESEIIRSICKRVGIPSATVRVISDAADESLPLDFNELMTSEQTLDYLKLLWTVLKRPGIIPALLRLGRQTKLAAQNLAEVLRKITHPP